jgi:hypothetical protein
MTVRRRPLPIDRNVASAATTRSRTHIASAVLPRLMIAVAGTAAVIAAATIPARAPATRRVATNITTTVSTPATTCGITSVQVDNPNARTTRAWIQNEPGNLSRVIVPAGSKPPYANACQLVDIVRTAPA